VDKVITTTLLILAGVVCVIFVFSQVFPMINRSSSALVSMSDNLNEQMQTRISIINASVSSDRQTVYIWIKNIGETKISNIEQSDLFFGEESNFARIPYQAQSNGVNPQWSYQIENDTEWKISATIKIAVSLDSDPGPGTYFVKIVLPNGVAGEYYFSL
jgi:archaellum component FlaF (FlaF/FlaG flagellin family)